MTDGSTPDQPPKDPVDGAGPGMISEDELDQILAQASSLAADLSQEVGPAETPQPAHSVTDAGSDLGAELSELERLVAETAGELDDQPTSAVRPGSQPAADVSGPAPTATYDSMHTPAAPLEAKHADPSKPLPVPDFMAEFMQPEEGTGGGSAIPSAAPSAASSKPGPTVKPSAPVSLPKPGVVSSGGSTAIGASIPSLDEGVPHGAPPQGASVASQPRAENQAQVAGPAGRVRGAILSIALGLCEKGVSVLEAIDRPFARLGRMPRQVIGLLAVATAGTAVIVLLLSLF